MDNLEQTRTNSSYGAGIAMLILFAIGGFMLSLIVCLQVWSKMTGMDYEAVIAALPDAKYMKEAQFIQSISMVFGFLIPAIFAASRLNTRPLSLMGFKGTITVKQLLLTAAIFACAMYVGSALGYLSYQLPLPGGIKTKFDSMEAEYAKQASGLISLKTPADLVVSLVVIALVPAICEEAFFRGGLQNFLFRRSRNMWLAVIVTSLIFSAVHFSGYGFLTRVLLGLVLGLIYHYSGRLWLSILAHFINNSMAIFSLYFSNVKGTSVADAVSERAGNYWGFLALPILIYLLAQLKKASPKTIAISHGV